MKRKTRILLISYGVAAFAALIVALAACRTGAARYERRLDANDRHAFAEVLSAVQALDTSLQKSAWVATPAMTGAVCTQIYSDAQTAQMALGVLPVQTQSLENIAGQIAVLGDYAFALSRAAAAGAALPDDAREELLAFSDTTAALYEKLAAVEQALSDGAVTTVLHSRLTDALDNLESETAAAADTLDAEMTALAADFPAVPALDYDGAYADRSGDEWRQLVNAAEVTEDEARAAAARLLDCDAALLTAAGRSEGETPCWNFTLPDADGEASVAVTVRGGRVLYYASSCASGATALSHEAALAAATAFLARGDYENPTLCTFTRSGNTETLVFAACPNGVLCYPDELRVTVCLESGKILTLEAEAYLKNHTQRDLAVPDADAARAAVPASAELLGAQPVVLAGAGGQERLCWEFSCADADGARCLLAVNAETGAQERILLVIADENGLSWR